jgi:hypothetical protein
MSVMMALTQPEKRRAKMKRLGKSYLYVMALGVLLLAANANAQECYLSTECEADLVCLDNGCVAPAESLASCADDSVCAWNEVCSTGFCKPAGVICENDWGSCHAGATFVECSCDSGMGFGTAMDSGGDGEEAPEVSPEALADECEAMLAEGCEAPPDPAEHCSESDLQTCTDLTAKMEALDEACEEFFDELYEDDVDTTEIIEVAPDTPTTEPEPAPEPGTPDEEGEVPSTEPSGDTAGDDDEDGDGEEVEVPPTISAQEMTSPWEIVECCEELQYMAEQGEEEERQLFACILALADDDCEGLLKCDEAFGGGYIGMDEDSGGETKVEDGEEDRPVDVEGPDVDEDDATIGLDDEDVENTDQDGTNTGVPGDGEADGDVVEDGAPAPAPATEDPAEPDVTTPPPSSPEATGEEAPGEDAPGEEASGGKEKGAGESSSDSGCSFAPVSHGNALMSLVKLVVKELF